MTRRIIFVNSKPIQEFSTRRGVETLEKEYVYNEQGLLIGNLEVATNRSTRYKYDSQDRVIEESIYRDNELKLTTNTRYDELDRIDLVKRDDITFSFNYNKEKPMQLDSKVGFFYGGKLKNIYEYDNQDRLVKDIETDSRTPEKSLETTIRYLDSGEIFKRTQSVVEGKKPFIESDIEINKDGLIVMSQDDYHRRNFFYDKNNNLEREELLNFETEKITITNYINEYQSIEQNNSIDFNI